jgi:hypothetical protein
MSEDDIDERFALGLVADMLIEQLNLRPEAREDVLAEVKRERELVVRWLKARAITRSD